MLFSRIAPQDLYNLSMHSRSKSNFAKILPEKRRARIFRAACEATSRDRAHLEAFAANYFARRGRMGVIEEDSIFPCRHCSLVSSWLRLQSCGLLSSFFMFSLFDVVSLGGLLIQSFSSAHSQYCVRNAYHFTNFPFIPGTDAECMGQGAARRNAPQCTHLFRPRKA